MSGGNESVPSIGQENWEWGRPEGRAQEGERGRVESVPVDRTIHYSGGRQWNCRNLPQPGQRAEEEPSVT